MCRYNKMYPHLEVHYTSMNQYFPNELYIMLQNQAQEKDLLKVHGKPIYNSLLIKFQNPHSSLTLQNYHVLSVVVISKNNIHDYLEKDIKGFFLI